MEQEPVSRTILIEEVAQLPGDRDYRGIHYLNYVSAQVEHGHIDRDGANALIASKLAERAFSAVVKQSVEEIKSKSDLPLPYDDMYISEIEDFKPFTNEQLEMLANVYKTNSKWDKVRLIGREIDRRTVSGE